MRSLGINDNISLNAHANASITHRLVIYQLNTTNSGGHSLCSFMIYTCLHTHVDIQSRHARTMRSHNEPFSRFGAAFFWLTVAFGCRILVAFPRRLGVVRGIVLMACW